MFTLGLCGLLDALGRVFRVFLLLNYGFLEVIFLFLFMHVVASLPHLLFLCFFFHFCHFGSGFFVLTSSFCEPYQLTEGSKCRVFREKYYIIMGCEALPFGFNRYFFLVVVDCSWRLFSWALTILLCLVLGIGLCINFHEFISLIS